jgi:hypothetical protein
LKYIYIYIYIYIHIYVLAVIMVKFTIIIYTYYITIWPYQHQAQALSVYVRVFALVKLKRWALKKQMTNSLNGWTRQTTDLTLTKWQNWDLQLLTKSLPKPHGSHVPIQQRLLQRRTLVTGLETHTPPSRRGLEDYEESFCPLCLTLNGAHTMWPQMSIQIPWHTAHGIVSTSAQNN